MFGKLKMKIAARRVERQKARAARKNARAARKKAAASAKTNRRGITALWAWVRGIDLIGLVNLTLLVAIIAIFSMLIIDILNCRRPQQVIVVAKNHNAPVAAVPATRVPTPTVRTVKPRPQTKALPIQRDAKTRVYKTEPVTVVAVKPEPVVHAQTARVKNDIYGDTIIDSRGAATVLKTGMTVNGNLYLQNMRKYTLPCGVRINGNLFLRDLNWLQFCGEFTVTGNIYVSPRSSFAPIPRTARVGGLVIL